MDEQPPTADAQTIVSGPDAALWSEENGVQTPAWTVTIAIGNGTRTLWFQTHEAARRYVDTHA